MPVGVSLGAALVGAGLLLALSTSGCTSLPKYPPAALRVTLEPLPRPTPFNIVSHIDVPPSLPRAAPERTATPQPSATPEPTSTATPTPAGCGYLPGAEALVARLGTNLVGRCLGQAREDPASGNLEQRTAHGLLVWLRHDDLFAFTDGATTWYGCPAGTERRPTLAPSPCPGGQ
jgi:hypothetical protein